MDSPFGRTKYVYLEYYDGQHTYVEYSDFKNQFHVYSVKFRQLISRLVLYQSPLFHCPVQTFVCLVTFVLATIAQMSLIC